MYSVQRAICSFLVFVMGQYGFFSLFIFSQVPAYIYPTHSYQDFLLYVSIFHFPFITTGLVIFLVRRRAGGIQICEPGYEGDGLMS